MIVYSYTSTFIHTYVYTCIHNRKINNDVYRYIRVANGVYISRKGNKGQQYERM